MFAYLFEIIRIIIISIHNIYQSYQFSLMKLNYEISKDLKVNYEYMILG